MRSRITIHKALPSDLRKLERRYGQSEPGPALAERVADGCVLIAEGDHRLLASAGIDLDRSEIRGLKINSEVMNGTLGPRLISEIEKLAASFGIFGLSILATADSSALLRSCGYDCNEFDEIFSSDLEGNTGLLMRRSFPRRRTRYSRMVSAVLSDLGIAQEYGQIHRIPLQLETIRLKSIGQDIYQREQKMLPGAADAWLSMRRKAQQDNILIQAVSAFRSVSYQAGLVRRKLANNQSIEKILQVSAAPGFSEHHTGRAIDVTTHGYPVLEEIFDSSPAFRWLQDHASEFGFHMSFAQGNRHGLAYEPWHWAWRD